MQKATAQPLHINNALCNLEPEWRCRHMCRQGRVSLWTQHLAHLPSVSCRLDSDKCRVVSERWHKQQYYSGQIVSAPLV